MFIPGVRGCYLFGTANRYMEIIIQKNRLLIVLYEITKDIKFDQIFFE